MNTQVFIGSTQKTWHPAQIVSVSQGQSTRLQRTSSPFESPVIQRGIIFWVKQNSSESKVTAESKVTGDCSARTVIQIAHFFDMLNQILTLEKSSSLKVWLVPGTGCPGVWSQYQACQN